MNTNSLRLLICTFDGDARGVEANAAMEAIQRLIDHGSMGRLALVRRDIDGKITVSEPDDPRESISGIASTMAGGVAWFVSTFVGMFGPASADAAEQFVDATVHRQIRDAGFPDNALYEIGQDLRAGSTALVALIAAVDASQAQAQALNLGGRLWEHEVPTEVVEQLRTGAPEA